MTLEASFQQASDAVKALDEDPGPMVKLELYALYKQATDGDVKSERPGFSDMVGRAKWDAWNQLNGVDTQDAMRRYVDLVESLK